jgi:hypothetical protein
VIALLVAMTLTHCDVTKVSDDLVHWRTRTATSEGYAFQRTTRVWWRDGKKCGAHKGKPLKVTMLPPRYVFWSDGVPHSVALTATQAKAFKTRLNEPQVRP